MKFGDAAAAEERSQNMLIGIARKPYPSVDALYDSKKP